MANNDVYIDHNDLLDVVILDVPAKGVQYRLTVSEFRGSLYMGVREWYASFDNCFAPSNNGFNMPYNLHSCSALFRALATLLAKAETKDEVNTYEPFIEKTEALDLLSLRTAIPSSLLPKLLETAEIEQKTDEITIRIKLPEGSSWLS
jgi:hypothetical protein